MSRPRARRIPRPWTVALALVVSAWWCAVGLAHRPRPYALSKRNPTYAPLSPSSIDELSRLSDLDANLDFNDPTSFLSQVLVPRAVASANLTRLQREFERKFTALGWHVEKDVFTASTPLGDREFTNLVFTHDPDAARRLTLSAHLDSKYFPPSHPAYDKFVGATDSAVPCAILYDLAASLTQWLDARRDRVVNLELGEEGLDARQGETLQVVLFDGEEAFQDWTAIDSIYGARHLVEKWSKPLVPSSSSSSSSSSQQKGGSRTGPSPTRVEPKTELEKLSHLVLLDLLGSRNPVVRNFYSNTAWLFDEFVHSEQTLGRLGLLWNGRFSGSGYDDVATSIGQPHKEKSFFVDRRKAPGGWFGTIEDDHVPFVREGVPVVHLISVPFPKVWHTIADDASALDLETIKAWALIVRLTVAEYLGLDPELNKKLIQDRRGGGGGGAEGGGEGGQRRRGDKDELTLNSVTVVTRETGICIDSAPSSASSLSLVVDLSRRKRLKDEKEEDKKL